MKQTTEEFNKIMKELSEIMKSDCIAKIYSHIMSLERQNEDLLKSRNLWRKKYEQLKGN